MAVLALALGAPAVAGLNEWGHSVDAVLFSRVATGVGPSAAANPGTAGMGVSDTRVIVPGANEVSVRAFVTDVTGHRVPGVAVSGTLTLGTRQYELRFAEVLTPDGDLVYDAQRISYAGGDARGTLLFDFDGNRQSDDQLTFFYRDV